MDNLESKIVIFGANGAIGDAFVNHYVDSCVYTVSRKKLDNKIINTKNLTIQKFDDEKFQIKSLYLEKAFRVCWILIDGGGF